MSKWENDLIAEFQQETICRTMKHAIDLAKLAKKYDKDIIEVLEEELERVS